MTDLLVSSLMADGGLEAALSQAFRKETQEMEELKVNIIFWCGVVGQLLFYGLFILPETDSNSNPGHKYPSQKWVQKQLRVRV